MLPKLTDKADFQIVLTKLIYKQKQYLYQIAKLEYRIFISLFKLNEVNEKIIKEEANMLSIKNALIVVGEGEVREKLKTWEIKAEYKLFRLHLRKSKINIAKIVLNQSKLLEISKALKVVENTINEIENQEKLITNEIFKTSENSHIKPIISLSENMKGTREPDKKYYKSFNDLKVKMAS